MAGEGQEEGGEMERSHYHLIALSLQSRPRSGIFDPRLLSRLLGSPVSGNGSRRRIPMRENDHHFQSHPILVRKIDVRDAHPQYFGIS
jgi:hypothetical protein